MGRTITIKDIARAAGVSIGTVDRVIHQRGEVAEETFKKVMSLCKELNYKPNLHARAITQKHESRIAVLLPEANDNNAYWHGHQQGVKQIAEELESYLFRISIEHFDIMSEDDFRRGCDAVLELRPHGVVFAPIFKQESIDFAHRLDKAGIPYSFVDTFVEGTACVSFTGEDAYCSGRVAASLIDFGLSPDMDILIVNIAKNLENSHHLTTRNQGFKSYFEQDARNRQAVCHTIELSAAEPELVMQKIKKVLDEYQNIGGIWVSGAKSFAVAACLEKLGRKDIILVGYDVFAANAEYVKNGYINFLIEQQPREQSMKAVQHMFDYLAMHTRPKVPEYQQVEIVNAENIQFLMHNA